MRATARSASAPSPAAPSANDPAINAPNTPVAASPWPVFWVASIAVFLVSLDGTMLYAAFGALRAGFPQASAADMSWVLNAYTVVFAAMLIPSLLVTLFAPGFTGVRHDLTATMMQIMMPLLPLSVVGSLLVAVLQANRRYWVSEGNNLIQRGMLVAVLAVAHPQPLHLRFLWAAGAVLVPTQ